MIANTIFFRRVSRVLVFTLGVALLAGCRADTDQTAKGLVATWTVVSATVERDGKTEPYYGPDPKGTLMFDENGRYSLIVLRSDLPKFASGDKDTGTPEENRAVVQGSIANYGKYSVEGDKLVLRIEAATFPNWNGIEQKRPYTITGDELKYIVDPAAGGGKATFVWKRMK